jgi:signal transduction histidine kinase
LTSLDAPRSSGTIEPMPSDGDPARLEALLAEQAALRRVATLVANETPAATLFDSVCQELGGVMDVKSTDMIRYDEHDAVVVGAWAASGAPSFPVGERIPVDGETVTAKLLRTGRTQRVDDYAEVDGELAARLRGFGILSVIGAPIMVAGELWGAIMATSERPHSFPPDTEHRIGNFAELVTAALANVDAREQLAASRARIVAAGDEARRRIERDLHDGAQQRLVALALRLQLLHTTVEEGSVIAGELATAEAELGEALSELRELASGIHPSLLSERGLVAALDALTKRVPIAIAIDADPDCDEVPAPLQTTAYFVVAEALTNAAKHADCDSARVHAWLEDESVVVEVGDDGAGGADKDGGTGLRGLDDRVSALAGSLEVESPPGGGTTIRARIPLDYCERLERERAAAVA